MPPLLIRLCLFFVASWFAYSPAMAAAYSSTKDTTLQSLFDFIADHDSVRVLIKTNFKKLLQKKDKYQTAHITIQSRNESLMDYQCEIRSRGNIRKKICYMPPTKLRFEKAYLKARGFSTYPTLKVVNACSFNERDENYIKVENLMYDLYGVISKRSFRTKMIHLRYEDTEGKKKPVEFEAFLIEHIDQVADRLNGEVYTGPYFMKEALDRPSFSRFAMFQYMIGNTDWKVLNMHNLQVIKVRSLKKTFAIAYDFDYAGMVRTHYSVPNEALPIKHVTERLYLGPCQTEDEIEANCLHFLQRKEAMMTMLSKVEIPEKRKASCQKYIDQFFKIMEDKKKAKSVFSKCIDY